MAHFRMDPEVILEYSTTVEESAAKLSPDAVAQLSEGSLSVSSFGEMAQDLEVVQAYERAKSALRKHLEVGAAALHSASASLREVTTHHAANEEEAIRQVGKTHKFEV